MPIPTTPRTAIGWPVLADDQVAKHVITVTGGTVTMRLRSGDVADILTDVVARFDATVQPVYQGKLDDWSYNRRKVRENSTIWSEHAAGTAIDLNATQHGRGARGTFSGAEVAAIRDMLALYEGVVAWGGDFGAPGHSGHTPDEMHFQINVPPGDPAIARVAAKIRALEDDMPTADEIAEKVIYKLIHTQYTGDEGGVQLDKRSIAGVALVGARASLTLLEAVSNVSKQVQLVAVAVADDATKAQVQELGDKVDQLLAEVTPTAEPAPPAGNS